ncbi:MAG: hypothetical protein EPO39_17420 [Candidatus Manganitrophaceae bacterium]|nr:MAG: hypothetical protein EPO39_17420 [Candidatus Manganitrophaceae bacterium]
MQDRVEQIQVPTREAVVEKKDLGALWAVGVVLSLILTLAGYAWNPPRYEALVSNSVDPTEAQVENGQNKIVADALNQGKVQYDKNMVKLVRLRPAPEIFFIDLFKLLLFPTAPIVIVGMLIRKSIQQARETG